MCCQFPLINMHINAERCINLIRLSVIKGICDLSLDGDMYLSYGVSPLTNRCCCIIITFHRSYTSEEGHKASVLRLQFKCDLYPDSLRGSGGFAEAAFDIAACDPTRLNYFLLQIIWAREPFLRAVIQHHAQNFSWLRTIFGKLPLMSDPRKGLIKLALIFACR